MSVKRKFEGEVEVSESAGDVFHDMYKTRPHHLSQAAPHTVQRCDLHQGVFGSPGSILTWNFTLDGKAKTSKTEIEEIDEEKKLVRQKLIESDYLDNYKSMVFICHVVPKDKETSIVKWILEYEKMHPGIPEPSSLMDGLLSLAKDVHDHHHGVKK